jgi:hypothetical protein
VPDIFDDPMEDVPQEPHNSHTHFVFMAIYKINGNLFTNQTGHFPITTIRSHAYVVVFYIYNANTICSVLIKNCLKEELLHAYCKIYTWLTLGGFKPLLHKLYNERSKDMFQLTNAPPMAAYAAVIDHRKRRNIALSSLLVAIASTI